MGQLSELRKNSKNQLSSLYCAGTSIITISGETQKTYIGFDICTEDFIEVEKSKVSRMPEAILKLLISQDNRLKIAMYLSQDNRIEAAKILGVTDRTVRRNIKDLI